MRKRLLVGVLMSLMVVAGPGADAQSTARQRSAQHQAEVKAKIGCNRAEERAGKCSNAPAPAPAAAPAAKPTAQTQPSTSASGGPKKIVISIAQQRLRAYEGNRLVLDTPVSTGRAGHATPRGTFSILSKETRHWSTQYHVWMPYAMRVVRGIFIHEIPITPEGRRLGASSLGQPVSAGCIRVGIGPAGALYRWTPVGTPVVIQ